MTAITIADLDRAKLDVDHIADIATSLAQTAVDRLGHEKLTLVGAIDTIKAINNRGAWVTATGYLVKDIVLQGGTWWICVVAHTSSAAFATDQASKWRVYQGVIASDLAAIHGADLIGYQNRVTGAVPRNTGRKLDDLMPSLYDFLPAPDIDPATVTDWTNTFNAAIAFANVTHSRFWVPDRDHHCSDTSAFIFRRGGWMGSGSEACKISITATDGRFVQIGDDAAAQFSCIDIKLSGVNFNCVNGTLPGGEPAISIKNAFRTRISDMHMQGVGKAIWINGSNVSVDVYHDHISVAQTLVNESCFRNENGNVVIYDYCKPYVIGSGLFPPTDPPAQTLDCVAFDLAPAAGKSCDTYKVMSTCESLYFWTGQRVALSFSGCAAYNIWLSGTYDSNVGTGIDIFGATGTVLINLQTADECWATSRLGYALRLSLLGTAQNVDLGGHFTQTGVSGVYLGGGPVKVTFRAIVDDIDISGTGSAACVVVADNIEAVTITSPRLGGTSPGFSGATAEYAVSVETDIARLLISGVDMLGTVNGIRNYTPGHSAGSVDRKFVDNVGDSANQGHVTFTLPASGATYTNKTGYVRDIFIYGGTVSSIAVNSTVYTGMTSGHVTLQPGWTMTVAYSSAPSVTCMQT